MNIYYISAEIDRIASKYSVTNIFDIDLIQQTYDIEPDDFPIVYDLVNSAQSREGKAALERIAALLYHLQEDDI